MPGSRRSPGSSELSTGGGSVAVTTSSCYRIALRGHARAGPGAAPHRRGDKRHRSGSMSPVRQLACVAFAGVPVVASAAPASAQTHDAAAATQLFQEGRDLLKQGKHAAACAKLAESQRLDARVGTLLNLADCEET